MPQNLPSACLPELGLSTGESQCAYRSGYNRARKDSNRQKGQVPLAACRYTKNEGFLQKLGLSRHPAANTYLAGVGLQPFHKLLATPCWTKHRINGVAQAEQARRR